jgi:hypothetical protein
VQLLGLAEAQWAILWVHPPNLEFPNPLLDRLRDELSAQLGPAVYATALEFGRTLDLDATIAGLLADIGA